MSSVKDTAFMVGIGVLALFMLVASSFGWTTWLANATGRSWQLRIFGNWGLRVLYFFTGWVMLGSVFTYFFWAMLKWQADVSAFAAIIIVTAVACLIFGLRKGQTLRSFLGERNEQRI